MNKTKFLLIVCAALTAMSAHARDTEYKLPIDAVLNGPDQDKFAGVKFFFGKQKAPAVGQQLGEFVTNKKTGALGRTDEDACKRVMASALIQFAEKAKSLGGDAVVNLRSYYKKDEFSSETEYECHAGATVAGVALKGDVVKLK
jgi:uncharacterized protein YbjQ (UPF0145 family)